MRSSCKPVALIALAALVLTACGASKLNPYNWFANRDTIFNLVLCAGNDINKSRLEIASPLVIRFYELKSPDLFQSADFLALYLQDTTVLQHSLVKKQCLPAIHPGDKVVKKYTLNKATRYIALLGEFEDYISAVPSVLYKVTPGDDNNLKVLINGDSLQMASANKSS